MVIGVDSSHIKGKGTGVAMVATINDTFTDFFNKEEIINEKNKEQLQYSVSSFIKEAVVAYNKRNKKNPKNIIIYRQGVSLQQKEFLKTEIKEITLECKKDDILFYYILVNTKTTFKFFEKAGKQIDDGVVSTIYKRFDGTTWYLQKVLNQLFATKDSVIVSDVDVAVEQIINQNEEAYKDVLYQLTARQRDLLVAVSREGKAKQITGMAFVKRNHLSSASSVQKSAQALTEKQLLTHQQGIYEVYDKFMSEWLQKS